MGVCEQKPNSFHRRHKRPSHGLGNSIPLSSLHTLDVDPIKQQGKIGGRESQVIFVLAGEFLECSCFESLVPDRQPVTIPVEKFDPILFLVDENEESSVEHIFANMFFGHSHQAVETFSHVGRDRAEINVIGQVQHDFIASRMVESVFSSQPAVIRTVVPLA